MSDNLHITPKVGIAIIIRKNNRVLLGERIHKNGNAWFFPSGHLEVGESILDCAKREVFEETGLNVKNLNRSPYITEDSPGKLENHFITIYVLADYQGGKAEIKEPNKCAQWNWFDWDNLPDPQVDALKNFLKNKYNPFI